MRKLYTAFARFDSVDDEWGCDSGRSVYVTDTLADAERQMAEWVEGYSGVRDGYEWSWWIRRGGTDEWTSWKTLSETCHLATDWSCAKHLDLDTLPGYFGEPIPEP